MSVLPEILEPIRRYFRVSNRMHDILVPRVVLKRPGIMAVISELIAGRVPEHVRVNREWQLCGFSNPGDRFQESRGRGRTAAFGDEDVARFHILPA